MEEEISALIAVLFIMGLFLAGISSIGLIFLGFVKFLQWIYIVSGL